MDVGIISMQKIHNYGSFLQALSLKIQLEKRGCNVFFIDIIPGKHLSIDVNKSDKRWILSKFDKYFLKRIANFFFSKKMDKIHIEDYTKYLDIEKKIDIEKKYDVVVIGSDEVFNAVLPSKWGFTTQLFGNVENAKSVVTYAASCGSTTFESALKYGIIDDLKSAMSNLNSISVRDENTRLFVNQLVDLKASVNVDPVFLSDYDEYIPTITYKKPYMLVYAYENRISDEAEIGYIKKYADDNKLDIICVGMQQRWCKKNITANAFELLAYVKHANCIVTDTFHGTVFSIKYNKKFVTIIRESNYNKLSYLLKQFELGYRQVNKIETISDIMDASIDYKKVNQIILSEQEKSANYLNQIVQQG